MDRRIESKSYRVTTNATNTPWTGTVRLLSLVVCVTAAGSAWTIQVKNKEVTPKIVYGATLTAGTFSLALTDLGGIDMEGGIDIVTAGTTPGTLDVFLTAMHFDGK